MPRQPEPGRKTGTEVPKVGQPRLDGAVAALATSQHGVLALHQICELGLTASGVRKRAAAGRLHRIHLGVYALVPRTLLTREGHWMAAVLAAGSGAVLSHRKAAALHGLLPSAGTKIDVTIPGRSGRERAGIDIHRSTTLTDVDVTVVRNIPCTTIARTLFDIAEMFPPRRLERALDQAEIMDVLDLTSLHDQIERGAGRIGARRLKAVLDTHYIGRTPTANDFEERFLKLTRTAGFPDPEVNAFVDPHDGERAIRADFVWRERRLVVETDGDETHRTRQAFERDRRDDQRLAAAGWRGIRVTWRQIKHEPDRVAGTVATLLHG